MDQQAGSKWLINGKEPWCRHQMETFSELLALCMGIHRSPVNSPHKGPWRGALMFSLIRAWINAWVNNHEAGDLRRHRAHYDVIVMTLPGKPLQNLKQTVDYPSWEYKFDSKKFHETQFNQVIFKEVQGQKRLGCVNDETMQYTHYIPRRTSGTIHKVHTLLCFVVAW